jgi:hypothetical protein
MYVGMYTLSQRRHAIEDWSSVGGGGKAMTTTFLVSQILCTVLSRRGYSVPSDHPLTEVVAAHVVVPREVDVGRLVAASCY